MVGALEQGFAQGHDLKGLLLAIATHPNFAARQEAP
jgi:hypothetical protein